tara:strand:- start:690 stop:1559 length:870 start_codon:yes stop_codon:yes gene_type:complete
MHSEPVVKRKTTVIIAKEDDDKKKKKSKKKESSESFKQKQAFLGSKRRQKRRELKRIRKDAIEGRAKAEDHKGMLLLALQDHFLEANEPYSQDYYGFEDLAEKTEGYPGHDWNMWGDLDAAEEGVEVSYLKDMIAGAGMSEPHYNKYFASLIRSKELPPYSSYKKKKEKESAMRQKQAILGTSSGALIGLLINAIRGKSLGRGLGVGALTGLGTDMGAIYGASLGGGMGAGVGHLVHEGKGPPIGTALGLIGGGGLGAGVGGLGGYGASQWLFGPEKDDDKKKKEEKEE